jgi:hypothetical protein
MRNHGFYRVGISDISGGQNIISQQRAEMCATDLTNDLSASV